MANRYWVGGSGTWDASSTANWSATSGGSAGASAPTSSDAVIIDSASGSGTITTASGSVCAALTLDSATLGLTFGANHTCSSLFLLTQGSVNLQSYVLSCTVFSSSTTNTRSITFGTGKIQLTGNAATLITLTTGTGLTVTGTKLFEATYSGSTGTRTFAMGSAATGTEANAVNVAITAGTDTVSITTNRVLGSLDTTGFAGTLTLNAATYYGNFIISSGLTFGTVNGVTLAATSGTKTITTNGKTFDFPVTFNGIGGTWEFADALTQGSTRAFVITNGTVKLKAGATSTVGAFATLGTNQKYLQSTTAGSQATLSQASGTVTVSYLSIKDIAATGGATWNAYVDYNNVDQGDNTGWDFSNSPAIDNEFPIALRSLTQPKRF